MEIFVIFYKLRTSRRNLRHSTFLPRLHVTSRRRRDLKLPSLIFYSCLGEREAQTRNDRDVQSGDRRLWILLLLPKCWERVHATVKCPIYASGTLYISITAVCSVVFLLDSVHVSPWCIFFLSFFFIIRVDCQQNRVINLIYSFQKERQTPPRKRYLFRYFLISRPLIFPSLSRIKLGSLTAVPNNREENKFTRAITEEMARCNNKGRSSHSPV